MEGPKAAKYVSRQISTSLTHPPSTNRKRKITDKSIPNVLLQNPDFEVDSRMYQDLLDMERRLDWTMVRKKVEVQDALARNPTVRSLYFSLFSLGSPHILYQIQTTRTLRIFTSHTVSGQSWQTNAEPNDTNLNFETGENIPAWSFKIEGRLLEVCVLCSIDGVFPRSCQLLT